MKRCEFVWANMNFFATAHAIIEVQIATQQEAFCGVAPGQTDRWGRVLPEDDAETPKCPECRAKTRGMRAANAVIDRAVKREDGEQ